MSSKFVSTESLLITRSSALIPMLSQGRLQKRIKSFDISWSSTDVRRRTTLSHWKISAAAGTGPWIVHRSFISSAFSFPCIGSPHSSIFPNNNLTKWGPHCVYPPLMCSCASHVVLHGSSCASSCVHLLLMCFLMVRLIGSAARLQYSYLHIWRIWKGYEGFVKFRKTKKKWRQNAQPTRCAFFLHFRSVYVNFLCILVTYHIVPFSFRGFFYSQSLFLSLYSYIYIYIRI